MTSLKDFFFENRRKNVPESCSNESDNLSVIQPYISGKKLSLTEMAEWKL